MKIISINHDGTLRTKCKSSLGGTFGFIDSIKIRGVGSPRLIYISGVEEFDKLLDLSSSLNYTSIELFKKGLVLRFKKQNELRACAIWYEEITNIKIVKYSFWVSFRGEPQLKHYANIHIQLAEKEARLTLQPMYFNTGMSFFKKKPILPLCEIIEPSGTQNNDEHDIGWLLDIV